MGELETAVCFTFQLAQHGAIKDHYLGQKFERYLTLENIIPRQPDHAHATSTQNFVQGIAIKDGLSADKVTNGYVQLTDGAQATHTGKGNNLQRRNKGQTESASLRPASLRGVFLVEF